MSERRNTYRYSTCRSAKIILKDGRSIDCLVRDLSTSGARLEVANPKQVSDRFTLAILGSWNKHPCRVAWRKDNMIGAEYL
jgi:hypothetical protein